MPVSHNLRTCLKLHSQQSAKRIKPGDELFLSYGDNYWKQEYQGDSSDNEDNVDGSDVDSRDAELDIQNQ